MATTGIGPSRTGLVRRGEEGIWGVLRGRKRDKRDLVALSVKLRCAQWAKPPGFMRLAGRQPASQSRQTGLR